MSVRNRREALDALVVGAVFVLALLLWPGACRGQVSRLPGLSIEEMGQRSDEYRITQEYRQWAKKTNGSERREIRDATLILAASVVADAWSTQRVIDAGGSEANPLLSWTGDAAPWAVLAVGAGQLFTTRWAANRQRRARESRRWHGMDQVPKLRWPMFVGAGAHFGAAWWNSSQVRD